MHVVLHVAGISSLTGCTVVPDSELARALDVYRADTMMLITREIKRFHRRNSHKDLTKRELNYAKQAVLKLRARDAEGTP